MFTNNERVYQYYPGRGRPRVRRCGGRRGTIGPCHCRAPAGRGTCDAGPRSTRVPGGCSGFFRRSRFAFDVGATTLVDFEPGGVGGELLSAIGMPALEGDALPGYVAWLPDRIVTLYRNPRLWADERLR